MIDADLAIALALKADGCAQEVATATARAQGDAAAELARAQAGDAALSAATEARITALNAALEAAERQALNARPPWYAQPWFVAPVAAIVAGGLVAAASAR